MQLCLWSQRSPEKGSAILGHLLVLSNNLVEIIWHLFPMNSASANNGNIILLDAESGEAYAVSKGTWTAFVCFCVKKHKAAWVQAEPVDASACRRSYSTLLGRVTSIAKNITILLIAYIIRIYTHIYILAMYGQTILCWKVVPLFPQYRGWAGLAARRCMKCTRSRLKSDMDIL